MRRRRTKVWALLIAVAAPGLLTMSCSGSLLQEFRDALVAGAAGAVETAAGNAFTDFLTP